MMNPLARAAFALLLLGGTVGNPATAQEAAFEPITADVAGFLQDLFDKVPAPSVSARVPNTTCRKDLAPEPMAGPGGAPLAGAYLCRIDFGCGQVGATPVWFDTAGGLWFGPDSAERLVAMYCADSITDPERRKTLIESVNQGG